MKNELETAGQLDSHVKEEIASMLYFYSDHCAPCLSLRPKVRSEEHTSELQSH